MRMLLRGLAAGVLVAAVFMAGCEWEGTSEGESWNANYNWIDFSGLYKDLAEGVLVVDATVAFDTSSTVVTGVSLGNGDGSSTTFAGALPHQPIVPGSVLVMAGGVSLIDDGSGTLVSVSPGVNAEGAIVYSTGAYALDMDVIILQPTDEIMASYRFTSDSTATEVAGNSGPPIYSFILQQTGNRVVFLDSNGGRFEGMLYNVRTSANNVTSPPISPEEEFRGEIVASFYAEGEVNGEMVLLEGTMQGSLSSEYPNVLFGRSIQGNWQESGGRTGVFYGTAATEFNLSTETGTSADQTNNVFDQLFQQ